MKTRCPPSESRPSRRTPRTEFNAAGGVMQPAVRDGIGLVGAVSGRVSFLTDHSGSEAMTGRLGALTRQTAVASALFWAMLAGAAEAETAAPAPAAEMETATETVAPAAEDTVPATRALSSPRLASRAPDPLFADQGMVELRIEGPIRALVRDNRPDAEELDAVMSWRTADGETGSLPIEYRARGKSRRRPDKCDFPPIRLDLPKSQTEGTLFEHQDKLKLVTHCKRIGSKARDQYSWVWLEYYAYRILNTLTDYSYRVRPLTVTYVAENGREYVHPGFIIEHDERLAHRLGLEESEREQLNRNDMVPEITAVMEVYQYMIANTDFSFVRAGDGGACCHNAVQYTDGEGRFVPIPYDFDQIGLIDKPDAMPARGLGIRSVTDRVYRGFCRDPRHLEETLALFREKRAEIERIFAEEVDGIPDRRRRKIGRYMEEFWEVLDEPRRIEREFVDRCR